MAPIDESSGVYKKIIAQARAFETQGYECRILFVRDSTDAYLYKTDGSFMELEMTNSKDISILKEYIFNCKFCYVRFELFRHKYYRKVIIICKKLGVKVVSEIPTYPPYQESLARVKEACNEKHYFSALKTLLGTLFVILDVYIMTLYSKLVVLVADDKKFMFTKTVRIENGINIDDNPYQPKEQENVIRIIAVSNFSVWNGYDRAIAGLKDYINQTGFHDIKLIMVGDKKAGKSLEQQTENLGITDDVEFTGALSGADLDDAYARADIALGALGNHRRKVFANSSLKAKEYASRGMLMVLSDAEGIETEIRQTAITVPSDESPIDFSRIKKWYKTIPNIKETRVYIRNFAEKNYSWEGQVKKILNIINNEVK